MSLLQAYHKSENLFFKHVYYKIVPGSGFVTYNRNLIEFYIVVFIFGYANVYYVFVYLFIVSM